MHKRIVFPNVIKTTKKGDIAYEITSIAPTEDIQKIFIDRNNKILEKNKAEKEKTK